MDDLEDDIDVPAVVLDVIEPQRKLSRLAKGAAAKQTAPAKLNSNAEVTPAVLDANLPEQDAADPGSEAPEQLDGESGLRKGSEDPDAGEAEEEQQAEGDEDEEEEGQDGANGQEEEYWDEEDEIEKYLKDRFDGEESSDDEPAGSEYGPGEGARTERRQMPDNPTLDDLNAETQRILRDTAERDRLGRGQKIVMKPLTDIVQKLRERRALAIARAPKAAVALGMSFDDVLAAATGKAVPPAVDAAERGQEEEQPPAAHQPADGSDAVAGAGPSAPVDEEADDLDIVSEDEEVAGAGARVVELPSTLKMAPKPSPLAYLPYTQSRSQEEFEDVLIDDGASSGDESDGDSEHSWAVRAEEVTPMGKTPKEAAGRDGAADAAASAEEEEEEEEESKEHEEEEEEEQENEAEEEEEEDEAEDDAQQQAGGEAAAADAPLVNAFSLLGAAKPVPKHAARLQKAFLDTEAELSDEDGGAAAVSDDENEDDVDNRGELADLIATDAKESGQELAVKESLHRKWEEQREAKELQKVLRGLEQGFRGHRVGGGLDDGEDELDGRRRRARADDGDDEVNLAALKWPAGWGPYTGTGGGGGEGDEEECDDEEMLHRAKQQRLLTGSQRGGLLSPGAMPLDEDSQAVLGLLARSLPGSQQDCPLLLGSDPGPSLRAPSFLGRQPAMPRGGNGGGGANLGSGKSFVFGQRDASNSALPSSAPLPGSQSQAGKEGEGAPVSFANLRQMAGLQPGGAPPAGNGAGKQKRQRGAPSLVSRLGIAAGAASKLSASQPEPGIDAASAFCQHVVLGVSNKKR